MSAPVHPAPQDGPPSGLQTAAALRQLKEQALELLDARARGPPPAAAAAALDSSLPPFSPPGAGAADDSPCHSPLSSPCSPGALSPLSMDGVNPLLSPRWRRKSAAVAAARAALCSSGGGCSAVGLPHAQLGGSGGGAVSRLGDGLEAGSHAVGDTRTDVLQQRMRVGTLHRDDYPTERDWCPGVLEWIVAFPDAFDRAFTPAQRVELGRMYNPRNPQPLRFHAEDIIQTAAERMRCGGCTPRTPLRRCGLHGTESLDSCSRTTKCLHAGCSVGASTCLLDNFVRVAERVIAALLGQQPAVASAHLTPEQAAALERIPPREAAEGLAALFLYSYEIKAPPGTPGATDDGSRPTQLYKLLGCAMRNLGDPAARARLSEEQLGLWEKVIELMRPFTWRLDKILLALPHQPRVVYRGIDVRVSRDYKVGSVVLWPPVTSTSASKEVAWGFMSHNGSGTFFVILTLSVADIAAFSWLPEEEEWLLHTLSVHKVTDKMRPGLRAMVGTNHDMVCLVQVDGRSGGLPPEEMVRARELALREQTVLFDGFLSTYVPPAVKVGSTSGGVAGVGGRRRMLDALKELCAGEQRTVLIVGDGGSGKTSMALRIARAAADETDPLPRAPGCDARWAPMLVTLPVVDGLLTPGTGEGCAVRPLADYIVASNNLSPEELAVMQQRPLLLVLDALDELPEGLSRMRGRGLLAAGGLDLREWPNAKVVLCIRGEMLHKPRGCRRWRLTERDVLPGAVLWHVQDFGPGEVSEFADKVVRREMFCLAEAGAKAAPEEAEEVLQKSVAALRCAPPSLAAARDLQAAARRVHAEGAAHAAAAERAVDATDAGAVCRGEMQTATTAVVSRLRAADPVLVSSPFVLSMALTSGHALTQADLGRDSARAVYGEWVSVEVRRRLPRISDLAERCPEFAAMDEDARVALVLRFCGALACSPLFVDVMPSLLLIANLRRYAPVAYVKDCDLSPLGAEHSAALLEAAPLRVEAGEGALLSFPHASVQDYFAAARVSELSAQGDARRHPDVQRIALVLSRSASLSATVNGAMRDCGDSPVKQLRRRVTFLRCCQVVIAAAFAAWVLSLCMRDVWVSWLEGAGYALLLLRIVLPWRGGAAWRLRWPYALCGLVFTVLSASTVIGHLLCEEYAHLECSEYIVRAVGQIISHAAMCTNCLSPHYPVAVFGGFNIFEWPRLVYHRVLTVASGVLAIWLLYLFIEVGIALEGLLELCSSLLFAVLTYRLLRHTPRVRARRA